MIAKSAMANATCTTLFINKCTKSQQKKLRLIGLIVTLIPISSFAETVGGVYDQTKTQQGFAISNIDGTTSGASISISVEVPTLTGSNETLPWAETFSVADGSTSASNGSSSWTTERTGGSFEVQDGQLTINDGGSEGIMTTGLIDISEAPVAINLDLSSRGNLESDQDYVMLFAKIDGGPEELVGEKWGRQDTTTTLSGDLSGSTLQLVIRTYVSYADEYYYLDNLNVTGSTSEPEPTPDPSAAEIEHSYAKNDGPFKNPLKGWNSGWNGGNNHPESSVGFQYIPWKDFEPADGIFDRAAVEDIIDNDGSKNRHLILRLYCDWHGKNVESDCPDWMYSDAGVARLQGDNGRYITDFNDAGYIEQAQQAIQALAEEYDNDPRIYAVQMGVIGYWGEWHTYGSDFNGNSYDITDETKNAILNTYKESFSNARIMARYPWREPMQSAGGIGYHNDYFVTNNGHSEEFDLAITTGSQWTDSPIGGEVPPRNNSEANTEKADLFAGGVGQIMLETGHYSTMKAGSYRVAEEESGYEDYMRLHKKMGYNYQIDVARFAETNNGSEPLTVELIGTNIGVAPMYFDWDVQFALLDQSNNPVVTEDSEIDLTSILPGAIFTFTSGLDLASVNPGNYKLAARIIQPNADKPKDNAWKLDARNTYILFSNDLPVVDGSWSNNALVGGWSVLGNIAVQ